MVFDVVRVRVIRYLVFAALAGAAGWWLMRGVPTYRAAERLEADAERLERQTRSARTYAVRIGEDQMEDSIQAARVRFEALSHRVPASESGGLTGSDLTQILSSLATREGVQIRNLGQLQPTREGSFEVSGVRFRAVGSYHAIGAWMAGAVSVGRLVQFRDVQMRLIADSVLSAVEPKPAQVAGVPGELGTEGEEPLSTVSELSIVWFRRVEGAAPAESENGGTP